MSHEAHRRTHDVGRRQIAIRHLSDSGDLKCMLYDKIFYSKMLLIPFELQWNKNSIIINALTKDGKNRKVSYNNISDRSYFKNLYYIILYYIII